MGGAVRRDARVAAQESERPYTDGYNSLGNAHRLDAARLRRTLRVSAAKAGDRRKPLILQGELVERATRIELVTSSLGSWHSTAELRPLSL